MINWTNISWPHIILVIAAAAVGYGAKYLLTPSPTTDTVEQVAETIVEEETGVDIGLTPTAPAKKN